MPIGYYEFSYSLCIYVYIRYNQIMRKTLYIAAAALLVGVGGYFGVEYIKQNPPDFLIKLVTSKPPAPPLPEGQLAPLVVPQGFAATIFARDIKGARVLARDNRGVMLVSQTSEGKVSALPDANQDNVADSSVTVLSGLKQPHGILVNCDLEGANCMLYVAETDKLSVYSYDASNFKATFKKTLAHFPYGDGHYTRTLLMHPDGKQLLVSVGSSCNVCNEESVVRASVQTVDLATGNMKTFASGLRNSVFLATDYVTGEVWGTENGRDLIGDDIPPDEINIIAEGKEYGWPICYGQNIHDTDFDKRQNIRNPCEDMEPAHIDLQAHSAALGLAFVPEEGWPDGWGNDLLVAYHGSWNRSVPTGYKVVRIDLNDAREAVGKPLDFVTGFLKAGEKEPIGRPVALLAEPGGTVFISDDHAGAIYKVSLTEPAY
jgi:glucose/arabinose dehydrogenase